MNCFSCRTFGRRTPARLVFTAVAILTGCGAPTSESSAETSSRYDLTYTLTPLPREQAVEVELELEQGRHLLREMSFRLGRTSDYEGDGELRVDAATGSGTWVPPAAGGTLRWRADVPHARTGNGYDAWLDASFGLFRAEDVIPRARTRALRSAESRTRLRFELPGGWSVATQYQRSSRGGFRARSDERRFVQPSGWILLGDLGVRRDDIAGVRVAVAAPFGHGARRIDMLALLNWTLPELIRLFPATPSRLTIMAAGDPMWRGALSAPSSIFVHSERPLISENGTSTLLHEVMHVLMSARAEPGYDWLLEGFAEYYSLEVLRRSRTLTPQRHAQAIAGLREWAESAELLCGGESTGAQTALAVMTLVALDGELRERGSGTLDDVLHDLMLSDEPLNLQRLVDAATAYVGKKPDALHIDKLPGCRTMASASTRSP